METSVGRIASAAQQPPKWARAHRAPAATGPLQHTGAKVGTATRVLTGGRGRNGAAQRNARRESTHLICAMMASKRCVSSSSSSGSLRRLCMTAHHRPASSASSETRPSLSTVTAPAPATQPSEYDQKVMSALRAALVLFYVASLARADWRRTPFMQAGGVGDGDSSGQGVYHPEGPWHRGNYAGAPTNGDRCVSFVFVAGSAFCGCVKKKAHHHRTQQRRPVPGRVRLLVYLSKRLRHDVSGGR